MQLYDGGTVLEMMNARLDRGFSEQELLRIFTDVLLAVTRLHHRTKPIIHRDLKVLGGLAVGVGVAMGVAVGVIACTIHLYCLLYPSPSFPLPLLPPSPSFPLPSPSPSPSRLRTSFAPDRESLCCVTTGAATSVIWSRRGWATSSARMR